MQSDKVSMSEELETLVLQSEERHEQLEAKQAELDETRGDLRRAEHALLEALSEVKALKHQREKEKERGAERETERAGEEKRAGTSESSAKNDSTAPTVQTSSAHEDGHDKDEDEDEAKDEQYSAAVSSSSSRSVDCALVSSLHSDTVKTAEVLSDLRIYVRKEQTALLDTMSSAQKAMRKLQEGIRSLSTARKSEYESRVRLAQTVADLKGGGIRVLCRVRPLAPNEQRIAAGRSGGAGGCINENSHGASSVSESGGGNPDGTCLSVTPQTSDTTSSAHASPVPSPTSSSLSLSTSSSSVSSSSLSAAVVPGLQGGLTVDFISAEQLNILKPGAAALLSLERQISATAPGSNTTSATSLSISPPNASNLSSSSLPSPSGPSNLSGLVSTTSTSTTNDAASTSTSSASSSPSSSSSLMPGGGSSGDGGEDALLQSDEYTSFLFDRVLTPLSSQTQCFADVADIVASSLDGFNTCVFAYGQTGSGKVCTHTRTDTLVP